MHHAKMPFMIPFMGAWLVSLALGVSSAWMPLSDIPGLWIAGFWAVACISIWVFWRASKAFWRWWSCPVSFVPSDGFPTVRVRSSLAGSRLVFLMMIALAGMCFTWGAIPFSEAAQLLAGWRGRSIDLPEVQPSAEDDVPSEIALLPTGKVTRGQAAAVAAALREASGLKVWCFPHHELKGLEYDPSTGQLICESVIQPLFELAKVLPSPAPPHQHGLLLIVITDEDMRSRTLDWRFMLSTGFTDTLAIVSTARLKLALPLTETEAKRRVLERTQKLALRLIGLHVFKQSRDNDRNSLLGPTLRGIEDLDTAENKLRFDPLQMARQLKDTSR